MFIPVFPPTEASTMDSNEVGTFTKGIPRLKVLATNPPKSSTMPPPRLMIKLLRSAPYSSNTDQSPEATSIDLLSSPGSTSSTSYCGSNWVNWLTNSEIQQEVFESTNKKVFEGVSSFK